MSEFFFGQDVEVYLKPDTGGSVDYKLDVIGVPEFSREKTQEPVVVPTLPGGGDSSALRPNHTRYFETQLSPINFSFQTHFKPFRYDGTDGEKEGLDSAHDYAVEAILWQYFFSAKRDLSTNTARNLAEQFEDSYVLPQALLSDPDNDETFELFIVFSRDDTSPTTGYHLTKCVLTGAATTIDPNGLAMVTWSGLAISLEFRTDITMSNFATIIGRGQTGTTDVDNYIINKNSLLKTNGLRATVDAGDQRQQLSAFAQCVSVSGDTVVFGQRWMDNPDDPDDASFGSGTPYSYDGGAHVYCTKDAGETWELQDVLSLPVLVDDQNYNYFGNAKIAGNHLMAGGQGYSSGGVDCGGVAVWERVYEKTGPKWLPQNEILIPESKREDGFFGINIGMSNVVTGPTGTETWTIIAHPEFDHAEAAQSTSSPRAGAVEFWKFDENAGFQRKQAIYNTAPLTVSSITDANPAVVTTTASHGLTTSQQVSFTGTGDATYDDESFTVTVTGATTFTIPAGASPGAVSGGAVHKEESLGRNVDMYGNYAVATLSQEGFVIYYYDSTTGVWAEQHRETGNLYATPPTYYSKNVSISSNYLVFGNHNWDTPQNNIGRVLVYKRSGTNWSLDQTLDLPPDRSGQTVDLAQYGFGFSVSIDGANEDKILVSAGNHFDAFEQASNTGESGNGVVHLYVPNESGTFKHVKRIEREELNDGQSSLGQTVATAQEYSPSIGQFGYGIDCDGDIIAIGEPMAKSPNGTHQLTYTWYNASGAGNTPVGTVSFAGETKNVLKIARRHNSYDGSTEDAMPRNGASFVVAGKKYYLHNNSTQSDSSSGTQYFTSDFRSFEVTPYIQYNFNTPVLTSTELDALASAGSLTHGGNVTFSEEFEGLGHIYKLPKIARNEGFPLLNAQIEMSYEMSPITYPVLDRITAPIAFSKGAFNIIGSFSFYHEQKADSGAELDGSSFIKDLLDSSNVAPGGLSSNEKDITNNRTALSVNLGGIQPNTSRVKFDLPNVLLGEPSFTYANIGIINISFQAESSNHIGASNTTSDAITITYKSSGNSSRG